MYKVKANFKKYSVFFLAAFLLPVAAVAAEGESEPLLSSDVKNGLLTAILVFQIILIYTISGIIKNLTGGEIWKKIKAGKTASAAGLILLGTPAITQSEVGSILPSGSALEEILLWLNGILLVVILILLGTVKSLIRNLKRTGGVDDVPEPAEEGTAWKNLMQKLTDSVPVEKEAEVMTDHEYDGISELDNNLPPWWLAGFYITVAASVVYIFYFHIYLDGNVMEREYHAQMEQAEREMEAYLAAGGGIDEENLELLESGSDLDAGKNIYQANCVACHAADGGGGVGPNLTDEYWIHGGSLTDVYMVVKEGVPSKGMIAWKDQLSPVQMHQVASYVYTLRENEVEGKEPQGEKWDPEAE